MLVKDDDEEEDDFTLVTSNMSHTNKLKSTGNTVAYGTGSPV